MPDDAGTPHRLLASGIETDCDDFAFRQRLIEAEPPSDATECLDGFTLVLVSIQSTGSEKLACSFDGDKEAVYIGMDTNRVDMNVRDSRY